MPLLHLLTYTLSLAAPSLVALLAYIHLVGEKPLCHPKLPPRATSTLPIFGSVRFLLATWDFLRTERDNLALSNARKSFSAVSFRVGPRPIVAIYGTAARTWLVNEPNLNSGRGYQTFDGRPPARVNPETGPGSDVELTQLFLRRLKQTLTSEALAPSE